MQMVSSDLRIRGVLLRMSLGAWFETYDLFMAAYIAVGMIREKLFVATAPSPFAIAGFAGFVAAGFAGMFLGTLLFGWISDRFGRRATFTWSLVWYSVATLAMALSGSALAIDVWRFLAGIGIGVQIITIDTYVSEVSPKDERGRWIAFTQFIGYLSIPCAALLANLVNWRYVAVAGALGGVLVWFVRSGLPESDRWSRSRSTQLRWSDIWNATYRGRTTKLVVFNLLQTIGFYGFTSWVPIFLASEGISFTKSLAYAFVIAIVNPLGPLISMYTADRWQRKWQIVTFSIAIAILGLLFAHARAPVSIVIFGALITLANALFSCAFHAYQAELYPSRIRARAVGFVYSWSRFSSIFVGFLIAAVLRAYGTAGVFWVIALAMAAVAAIIGFFGVRTSRVSLEELAAS
jgi:putative MFS transporter